MIYEFASRMARRGHDVNLYHVAIFASPLAGPDEIDWFSFPPEVVHHFPPPGPVDMATLPESDVTFGYHFEGNMPPEIGLPVVLIQGWKMMKPRYELAAFGAPCPKICLARWLVDVGRTLGVPSGQLIHIPLGLRHDKFRVIQPVVDRPPVVAFGYNAHINKGPTVAIDVLSEVKRRVPETETIVFGALTPQHDLPDGVTYRTNPSQRELVEDIYNRSRVFLCTSVVEGFGLMCIEAMACGAALVTTDNGGSRDYSIHGRTALVADVNDTAALAEHVVRLLRDDEERVRLAVAGEQYVRRYDWERSADSLEDLLERYVEDPAAFGVPPEAA